MNQKVASIRAEQWRNTVFECLNRDPLISKRQWCKDHGISIRSLMYWQHKFQLEALEQMDSHQASLPVKAGEVNAPAFVDMSVQLEALQSELPGFSETDTAVLAPELMIQAGAYRIYVNGSVRENTLETVMKVLRHA